MNACPKCGCRFAKILDCPACDEETTARVQVLHAGHLRELKLAAGKDARTASYVPAIEDGIAALHSSARNHRHVAEVLRRTSPSPALRVAHPRGWRS